MTPAVPGTEGVLRVLEAGETLAGRPEVGHPSPAVAVIPWGILEDFLDPLGVEFEKFCREFTGSCG
jgi:hypothetical protein